MSKLWSSKKETEDFRFSDWLDGEKDPYLGEVEMKVQTKKQLLHMQQN